MFVRSSREHFMLPPFKIKLSLYLYSEVFILGKIFLSEKMLFWRQFYYMDKLYQIQQKTKENESNFKPYLTHLV